MPLPQAVEKLAHLPLRDPFTFRVDRGRGLGGCDPLLRERWVKSRAPELGVLNEKALRGGGLVL